MSSSFQRTPMLSRREAFDLFYRKVTADAGLFARLRDVSSYDAFCAQAVGLGAELGLVFSTDEVGAALRDARGSGQSENTSEAAPTEGWMPVRVQRSETDLRIDWCQVGGLCFSEPFFEQTIARALRDPARRLFRRTTSATALESLGAENAIQPHGFIFHVSRCGSTLLARMLASLPQNHVVSEPPPIDQLLEALRWDDQVAEERKIARLRGLIHALGRGRVGREGRYFIKFDSWHVLELPLIVKAFPDVPWVFVYREPVEVMVSHRRLRGLQVVPGLVDARLFDLDQAAAAALSLDEYGARVLAKIYSAGFEYLSQRIGCGRLVNFSELPAVTWDTLGAFWDVKWMPDDLGRLREASLYSAKTPAIPHKEDSETKQREASAELRRLADQWLAAPYARLEELRRAQVGCPASVVRADSVSSKSFSQSLTTQSITK